MITTERARGERKRFTQATSHKTNQIPLTKQDCDSQRQQPRSAVGVEENGETVEAPQASSSVEAEQVPRYCPKRHKQLDHKVHNPVELGLGGKNDGVARVVRVGHSVDHQHLVEWAGRGDFLQATNQLQPTPTTTRTWSVCMMPRPGVARSLHAYLTKPWTNVTSLSREGQ